MKKTVFIHFLTVLFLFLVVSPAFSSPTVIFNGRALNFDVPPTNENGRILVPLRAIFEALDADVIWDGNKQTITAIKGTTKIELTINQVTAYKNDLPVTLEVPAIIIKSRTLVPLRFVSEALGTNVKWDGKTQTITINSLTNPSDEKQQQDSIETIDYNNPSKYAVNGKQTAIEDRLFASIDEQLKIKTRTLSDIRTILNWKDKNFPTVPAGGKYIGKITVNEIIQKKELSGCHDHALLVGSVLRKYGFPVVMADATGIQFSLDYTEKTKFYGHVFLEIYVDGKWILLDSTSGEYVTNYEPSNPVIPIKHGKEYKGYYVMLKGIDPDDYGINSVQQLNSKQIEYSRIIKNTIDSISYPDYSISKF